MRKVIVEIVGKGTRTIKVGIDWNEIKRKKERQHITDLICSPRIIHMPGSDTESPRKSRCWKTTKKGEPHAERGWQRHYDRQPSIRRHRWGRVRGCSYPSARVLNGLDRCIHPNMNNKYLV